MTKTQENKYGIEKGKLYTVEEVEAYLKTSYRNIYNYIKAKKIEAFKVGKEWRISGEALIDFLEANSNQA